jgi:hypothetical protein
MYWKVGDRKIIEVQIFLEGLRKPRESSLRIPGGSAEFQTEHLPNKIPKGNVSMMTVHKIRLPSEQMAD